MPDGGADDPDTGGDVPDGGAEVPDGDEERRALMWAATSIGREAPSGTVPGPLALLGLILEELEPRRADLADRPAGAG